jgi:hypothetical protein
MKQKVKKIIISFLTFSFIICPFNNFSVLALSEESSFFEIESLQVSKNENIVMTINLDLIDYEYFNFKLESSESIQNIKTDEAIELTNESNEEVSFDFNKSNSNLSQITFRYEISDLLNVGSTITFKAIISDNTSEDSKDLELEYEVKIVENKTDNDTKDEIDNNGYANNEYNNDSKEIEPMDSDKGINLDIKAENNETNTNTDIKSYNSGTNTNTDSNIINESSSKQVVTYNGSDNNYLSSLSITNYELNNDFLKDRLTYFVTVESDVTSLEINATAENSNSIVSINGNTDLSDGMNKILITVTAENGNTKTYRIYVIKEN